MRMAIIVLSLAGVITFFCCQSAGAVAIRAAAIKEAASTASTAQQVRYYRHRHYIVKCYYELVVGPYVCHRFHRWW